MKKRGKKSPSLPPIDPDRFEFPVTLAPYVGISKNEINFLKKKGLHFHGKKTTLNLIRRFTGALPPKVEEAQESLQVPDEHLQH